MNNVQDRIGSALLKELIVLRNQKGTIEVDAVGEIFERLTDTLTNEVSEQDKFLRHEIEKMSMDIQEAKREIFALQPAQKDKKTTDDASQQLSAIVKFTEDATNEIMNIADELQALAEELSADKAEKTQALVARIFEACSFQDLTSQRIMKVTGALEYIDAKIARLVALFGNKDEFDRAMTEKAVKTTDQRPDKDLCNGPSDNAPDQSQIDALFGDAKTGTN